MWAQADRRAPAPTQFVVAVGFATWRLDLRRALYFFDNTDCLMVFAICVPSLGWLRLIFTLRLKTSDRTRTTWATTRQAGHQHWAGFNPNPHLIIWDAKFGKLPVGNRIYVTYLSVAAYRIVGLANLSRADRAIWRGILS